MIDDQCQKPHGRDEDNEVNGTPGKEAEHGSHNDQKLLRTVIENSRDGVNMVDPKTGEREHPEDREISLTQQKKAAGGQDLPEPVEYSWFSDHRKLVRDAQGRPLAMVGVSRDITDSKRAQEALRQSEDLLRAVINNSPDAIYVKDRESRWLMANPAVLRIVGKTAEQAIGHTDLELYADPLIGRAILENDRRILERGESEAFEEIADTPEGRRTFWSIKAPRRDSKGNTLGIIGISRDITAQKEANEELRRAKDELETRVRERTAELEQTAAVLGEEVVERRHAEQGVLAERQRFLDVLEALPVMICLLTPDHQVPFANRAYRTSFGAADGRRCHDCKFGRKKPCPACQAFTPLETGRPHRWELTIPGGRTIEVHNYPFRDADGSPLILEMDLDVTESRLAEKKLHEAHENLSARATQLRALAGELTLAEQRERRRMAKILHDHLQQFLVAAKFRTTLLGRTGDDVVGQAAKEVEQLLDSALDASCSLTAELSPPILHEAGLSAGLEWLARWMAHKYGLVIDISAEEGLPHLAEDVTILLFESTRELLFNAVKHAHVRSATVNMRRIDESELQITVSDTGPGFDVTRLKKAGEAGGGFGLFSIRERLALIGGRMEIDSTPGMGSRFTLTCPLDQDHLKAISPRPSIRRAARSQAMQLSLPIAGAKIRVLLADDHKIMREGLTNLLSQEPDIEIVGEAGDGEMAVRLAQKLRPDIVLMDLSMPKLSGIDATRAIREKQPRVQVIGLSMFDEGERAQSMYDAGAYAYLAKTGPTEALISAIRACWAAKMSRGQAEHGS